MSRKSLLETGVISEVYLKFGIPVASGFETDPLRYMKSYLTNRKHTVKVNKTFSE